MSAMFVVTRLRAFGGNLSLHDDRTIVCFILVTDQACSSHKLRGWMVHFSVFSSQPAVYIIPLDTRLTTAILTILFNCIYDCPGCIKYIACIYKYVVNKGELQL